MIAQLKTQDDEYQYMANLEAEELILGGILFDPHAIGKVANLLKPEHFYAQGHATIYELALELHRKGSKTDLMLMQEALESKKVLEKIGGQNRLLQLIERTASAANIKGYAGILITHYERRRLRDLAHEFLEEVKDRQNNPFQLQQDLITKITALNHLTPGESETKFLYEQIKQILQCADLTETEIQIKLEELRKKERIGSWEWRKEYLEPIKKELGDIEEKDSIEEETDKILSAQEMSLVLRQILPECLATPVLKLAGWLNLKPECYLTALLCGVSGLHFPKTKLIINEALDFSVTPNLYGGIVAPSSQKKSPLIKAMIVKPLRELQNRAREVYNRELEEYQQLINKYERMKKNDKENLLEEFPDGEPKKPHPKIYYFTNATSEAIINQFDKHPEQSLLYLKDELAGVFSGMNAYRGGKGSDEQDFLSQYDGAGEVRLRKSSESGVVDLECVPLSIFGGIQPKVLHNLLGNGEDDNGKWARFIFVQQPLTASVMSEDGGAIDLNPLLVELYEQIAGFPVMTYRLSRDAFRAYCKAYNEYEQRKISIHTSTPMRHVWGKAEGLVGKLALNLHCIEYAMKGEVPPESIGAHTINSAIALANFYAAQIESIYGGLGESLPSNLAKVIELCKRNNSEAITARDVYHSLSTSIKKSVSCEEIRGWFARLAEMGKGIIEGVGKGLKFKIPAHNDHNNHNDHKPINSSPEPKEPPENQNVGNVGNVGNVVELKPVKQPKFEIGDEVSWTTKKGAMERGIIKGFSQEKPYIAHINVISENPRLCMVNTNSLTLAPKNKS